MSQIQRTQGKGGNSLAAVAYSVEILRRRDGISEAREEAAAIILEQTASLQRLVDDLGELGGSPRSESAMPRMLTDVNKAVQLTIEACRPLMDRHGHGFDVSLSPGPLHAESDEKGLVQILTNLLDNAIRYTPNGGHIRLSIKQEDDAAVIKVQDNGIGIPKEMLSRVFDVFVRLENAERRYPDGMGIGLAFVRQLVTDQGGSVEAFSDGDDQGSEFVVRLPLAEDTRLRKTRFAATQQQRDRTPNETEPRDMSVAYAWG